MPTRKNKLFIGAAGVALAAGIAGGGVAIAGAGASGGEDDAPSVTGADADQATTAALTATGGGKANSVERDSEDGAVWEVEVTKADGTTVDVRLDGSYGVVVIEGDSESGDTESGSDDTGDSAGDED